MRNTKSGLLGLALCMAVLAACENKAPIVNVTLPTDSTPTVIALKIVPSSLTLNVGESRTLTAVVTGSANQAATWTSSTPTVATVSAAGVVNALTVGSTTITAVSAASATARDAINVTVVATGPVGQSTVSIQSVTQGGTVFPVAINNVQGQIDITLNVDIPQGSGVSSVVTKIDTVTVCTQTFTNGTASDGVDAAQAPVLILCSVNTAAYDSTGVSGATPKFLNGVHTVSAQIIGPGADPIATSVRQDYIFNNLNFINVALSYGRGCALSGSDPASINYPAGTTGPGTLWCGGSVTFGLRPVNYVPSAGTTNQNVNSASLSVTTGGLGSNGLASCDGIAGGADDLGMSQFPDCGPVTVSLTDDMGDGVLQMVFSDQNLPSATVPGLRNVEDFIATAGGLAGGAAVTVTSITAGGQVGPTCINPDAALNRFNAGRLGNLCATAFGGSAANVAFFAQPQRLDNLGPRVTFFTLPGLTQDPADPTRARYINAAFTFTAAGTTVANATVTGTGVIQNDVDYGVDRQNENLNSCPAAGFPCTVFTVATATGADSVFNGAGVDSAFAETETNNVILLSVTERDALNNVAVWFPTNTPGAPTMSSAAAARIGLDVTVPGITTTHTDGTCAVAASGSATSPAAGNCVYPDDDNSAPNTPADMWIFAFQDLSGDPGSGPSGFFQNPVRVWMRRTAAGVTTGVIGSPTTFAADPDAAVAVTNASSVEGYYRTDAFVTDAANNRSTTTSGLVLLDYTAPTMGGIGSLSTITGFSDVPFTNDGADNVELGDLGVYVGYFGSGYDLVHRPAGTVNSENRLVIGAYGDDATPATITAPVTVTRFIRSIETTNPANGQANGNACAAGAACAAVFPATDINYLLRDIAGVTLADVCPVAGAADNSATINCRLRSLNIAANVAQGMNNLPAPAFANLTFPSANVFGAGVNGRFLMRSNSNPWSAAPANSTVCNRPTTATCTNPRSVTLTATVNGPQASFAQPFTEVRFYYRDAQGREILIGTATNTFSIDDTVLDERRWVYQVVWTPLAVPPGPYLVFSVGVHSSGSALASPDGQTITVATS